MQDRLDIFWDAFWHLPLSQLGGFFNTAYMISSIFTLQYAYKNMSMYKKLADDLE